MEVSQGRFGNRKVSNAFLLPLRFTTLKATDKGNQITANLRPWQAGSGNRTGFAPSYTILRAIIPVKVMGRFAKLRRQMFLSLNEYKKFCKMVTQGVITCDGKMFHP